MSSFVLHRRRFLYLSAAACLATVAAGCDRPPTSPTTRLDPATLTWDEVVELARGTTVNWAMWGGSDVINRFADGWVAQQLQQQYEITLNRVPINDTVEAVNKVIGEVQAGLTSGGSIDLIWINGENFRTLRQGDLLFGPFTQVLPALDSYDPDDPLITTDFGLPVEGYESPYTGSLYVMAADTARVTTQPQNFEELLDWAIANPGRFTYVAPPAFDGSRFLLTALYGLTGGYEQYAGNEFDEALWEQNSSLVADYLSELAPHLWRGGQTYPPTQNRLLELFANGEIWMMSAFTPNIAEGITTGQLPSTTEAFALPGSSLNDPSFTAIPTNASNPAAAMVLANLLSSPEGQLEKFKPEVWGSPPLVDRDRLSPDLKTQFDQVEADYGLPLQALTEDTVPVVNAEYTTRLEQLWETQVAG
ncbi:MAG: ABC transporter substrate-binding protein [Kaiparowitsia implicata GSE-PSE-MK54-09C]|jgi:putative spermidine/putrescine transport system substrate-binding protein|nr:ABC transporter substrate-binding protein [Kaiparowitsia implicata GSE-PSE-MK54-09C]